MKFLHLLRAVFIVCVAFIAIVCIIFIVAAYFFTRPSSAIVSVVNQSEETIVLLRVAVSGHSQTTENLRHGEETTMQFTITEAEADYHIDVEFLSGRITWEYVGYLTPLDDTTQIITITKKGMEIETISRKIKEDLARYVGDL